MASSSGSGGPGGGRRYPHNLEGLLRFSAEQASTEDTAGPSNLTNIDPESMHPNYPSHANSAQSVAAAPNDPELARINQDHALEVLELHRYRVPGDGNCLFRAVAWQLKMVQAKYHPLLRKAAVKWMRDNKTELLEWGLLDGEKEIDEMEELGVWPGQAAIVALANIFRINIAVIQGGDKGDIDIQHICPFETAAQADGSDGSIILAYLYNGHYDAIVEEPNLDNPEFDTWITRRKEECEADEALARKLAAEEASTASSIAPVRSSPSIPTPVPLASPSATPDKIQQHVSEVYVSSQSQPLHNKKLRNRNDLSKVQSYEPMHKRQPSNEDKIKLPRPALRLSNMDTGTLKSSEMVHGLSPQRKAISEDEYQRNVENQLRLTLHPKKQASLDSELTEPKRTLYRPAQMEESQMRVNRSSTYTNVLEERQIRDTNSNPRQRTRSPSIRIYPLVFVGRNNDQQNISNVVVGGSARCGRELERQCATRRREYTETGPNNIWTETFSDMPCDNIGPHGDRVERLHQRQTTTNFRQQHTSYTEPPTLRRNVIPSQPAVSSTYTHSRGIATPEKYYELPNKSTSVARVVLSSRSADVLRNSQSSHARATPAPATFDLDKQFHRPPLLRPYKNIDSIRRNYDI